jgi:hypothetical protein
MAKQLIKRGWCMPMVLALASTITPALAHAEAVLFTGSASLAGLTLRLVDLTPDDGQTPWITFGQGTSPLMASLSPQGHADYSVQDGPTYPADGSTRYTGFLPNAPVSAQSLDGLASAQANATGASVSTHATLSTMSAGAPDDALAHLAVSSNAATRTPLSAFGYEVDADTGRTTVSASALEPGQSGNFTLSPHTRLVVEGSLSAQYTFSRSALSSDIQAALSDGSALVEGVAGVGLLLASANHEQSLDGTTWPSLDDAMAAVQAATHQSSASIFLDLADADAASESQTFSLALDNDGAGDTAGFLGVALDASLELHVPKALVPSTPSPIPEPGVWALMGLGLLAMSLVRRRPSH